MPRNDIAINISSPSGPRRVLLSLDPAQMSQAGMLGDFGRGQLYESETSNFLGTILQPGDTFIDIGAHVGYFSMLASALVGEQGRIYAFEPERSNFDHLVEHIALNGAGNIIPMHMAVGAVPAVADFFVNADNDGGHALWEVGRHPFNERTRQARTTRKVLVTSIDHFFADHDLRSLKAIKIDSEGAEFAILVGAKNVLAQYPVPFIVAEINRFGLESMGASESILRGTMSELGYETYLFQPGHSFLQRLGSDESPDTNYVFNILFRHPLAPAMAA
ncbi:MAG: FkbM family methyltransferase [Gemmatimonadaceae bacterium]